MPASLRKTHGSSFKRWHCTKTPIIRGALAQLVEQTKRTLTPGGNNPQAVSTEVCLKPPIIRGALAQLVARYIRIVEVTGSNPVCSTKPRKSEPFKRFGFVLYFGYCVFRSTKTGTSEPSGSDVPLFISVTIERCLIEALSTYGKKAMLVY